MKKMMCWMAVTAAVMGAMMIDTSTARADFWSKLRDKVIPKPRLPDLPPMQTVKFRNLTPNKVSYVIAHGNTVIGWYHLNGGEERELTLSKGDYYLHAVDGAGQLIRFPRPTSSIPLHQGKFNLVYQPDGTFRVNVDDQQRGTYARQFLSQLGFHEKTFFEFPENGNINFTYSAPSPPPIPPIALGRPTFEMQLPNAAGKTTVQRQPNGTWEVKERDVQMTFREVFNANGVLRLSLQLNGQTALIEIRGNQLYAATGNSEWVFAGTGIWRNL